MEGISYNHIVCEAFRYYINFYIEERRNSSVIWSFLFPYLVKTKYKYALLDVLKEENYIKNNKKNIIEGFYYGFKGLNQDQEISSESINRYQDPEKKKFYTYKIPFSKETLLNLFLYCEIPKDHSETLVERLFDDESYKNIILYYQKMLFDLFQVDI